MTNNTLTNRPTAAPFAALRDRIGRQLDRIVDSSHQMQSTREFERLSRLSDAELAHRGLRRDYLLEHAFRRYVGL